MGELNTVISVDYELRIKGGAVIESSAKTGPLRIVSGEKRLLPALEKRISALKVGQEDTGVLLAKDAFGDLALLPTKEIARAEFPADEKLEVGRTFEARATNAADAVKFRIVEVTPASVKVRFIHPLEDKDLEYRVKVIAIEAPGKTRRPPPPPASALGIDPGVMEVLEGDEK